MAGDFVEIPCHTLNQLFIDLYFVYLSIIVPVYPSTGPLVYQSTPFRLQLTDYKLLFIAYC